jgi:hypothetical protein
MTVDLVATMDCLLTVRNQDMHAARASFLGNLESWTTRAQHHCLLHPSSCTQVSNKQRRGRPRGLLELAEKSQNCAVHVRRCSPISTFVCVHITYARRVPPIFHHKLLKAALADCQIRRRYVPMARAFRLSGADDDGDETRPCDQAVPLRFRFSGGFVDSME